jgi:CMP-2-keto-3-deoxyoctulosonic acid synthetase
MAKEVTPILTKKSTHTGVMRGRDVTYKLGGVIDPIVVKCIADIAEINHTNCQAIAELATMQDQMLNIIQKFADVAENMKNRTDQLMRSTGETMEGDDESSVN